MLIQFILMAVMSLSLSPQSGGGKKAAASPDIPTVEFCELFKRRELYRGKEVRVRALYRSDFEESSLHSPQCYAPMLTWVEFAPAHRSCTKKKVQKRLDGASWGRSVDVVFVGRFETEGGYGHMDVYPTRLVVTCVEQVKPSGSFRPLPDEKR